jgi:hypothetical protein
MMANDERKSASGGPRPRFPMAAFLKALVPALVATVAFVLIFMRAPAPARITRADGMVRVTLAQKDSAFRPIPPSAGGAAGVVWYAPAGSALRFQLRATGLAPARRYVLELEVDSVVYTVASYVPNARGELAIDTTLAQFAEGVCVGRNFDAPRSVRGRHRIKFWVKRDGSPPTGTMPGIPPSAPGAQLGCHGNGDGDYSYILLENETADFTGTNTAPHGAAR